MRLPEVRGEGQRPIELADGRGGVPGVCQHLRVVVPEVRIARRQLRGPPKLGESFGRSPDSQERPRELVADSGRGGVDLRGPLERRHRLGEPAQPVERHPHSGQVRRIRGLVPREHLRARQIDLGRVDLKGRRQHGSIRGVPRQQLDAQIPHLVARLRPGRDPPGRVARVVVVRLGIVVGVPHRDARAARKGDRRHVAVILLPVKAPARDMNQDLRPAVRQQRANGHLLPKVVRVRVDAENAGVDRQLVRVLDRIVRRPRGDVDRLVAHDDEHGSGRRRRVGEVQAHRRPDRDGCFSGQQMQFDDKVGGGIETPRQAVRRDDRTATGGPPDEMPVGILDVRRLHALEPRLAIETVSRGRRAAAIHTNDGVVHRRAFGPELDRPHESHRRHLHRQNHIPVDVARSRREHVGPRHCHDEIGLAELPARGPGPRRRTLAGFAFGGSGIGPPPDHRDLRHTQPALAGECGTTALRQPGGHVSRLDRLGNLAGAPFRVGVGHQREGDGLAGTVAGLAPVEDDRRHVVIEGRRGACAPAHRVQRAQRAEEKEDESTSPHRPAAASDAGSEWRQ